MSFPAPDLQQGPDLRRSGARTTEDLPVAEAHRVLEVDRRVEVAIEVADGEFCVFVGKAVPADIKDFKQFVAWLKEVGVGEDQGVAGDAADVRAGQGIGGVDFIQGASYTRTSSTCGSRRLRPRRCRRSGACAAAQAAPPPLDIIRLSKAITQRREDAKAEHRPSLLDLQSVLSVFAPSRLAPFTFNFALQLSPHA